jgi:uncharacterized coiled-coil DUF342 family protein
MSKKEEIVWRLGKLPTPEEVINLVKDKIITQEEAREILFNTRTIEGRDKKSLEDEIKFLRELVETLSQSKSLEIVEKIKYIEKPYYDYRWYKQYDNWTDNIRLCVSGSTSTTNQACNFTSIHTW